MSSDPDAIKIINNMVDIEGKKPFLIGVAGGTASGKVIHPFLPEYFLFIFQQFSRMLQLP